MSKKEREIGEFEMDQFLKKSLLLLFKSKLWSFMMT